MPLLIGQFLNNRYRIETLIGKGGMGAVYRAWDLNLNMPVAVKENLDASPEALKQFGREAGILARLSHPNLPRVTDHFFISSQGQYLVMDFVEGEDLQTMLDRLGILPEQQVLNWIGQVCDALAYLHSHHPPVIHRDIKPANIKIRSDEQAMLVDFGIAKVYNPHLSTTIGAKAITPGYSPPEQYSGTTDTRSDIYALGATMYHLLTGHKLPDSVQRVMGNVTTLSPRQLNQQISPTLEQAILKAIEVAVDHRFQSVDELRAVLSKPADSAGIQISPLVATPIHSPSSSQQRPTRGQASQFFPWLLLGGVGLVLVILVLIALPSHGNMNLILAIILGIVQGLTEYIPVSSSAHLVLIPWLLRWPEPPFTFDVLVQWGTLVGVLVYFWRDLWSIVRGVIVGLVHRKPLETFEAKLGWYIVLATIPAVIFGLLFKSMFEAAFSEPKAVAVLLLGTAAMLAAAEYFGKRTRELAAIGWLDALIIGLWQVVSLLPGISRSGATITGGMLRGLDRRSAARFSFLMSVPALLGAGVIAIKDLLSASDLAAQLPVLLVSAAVAAITGYLCIRWLLGYLQRGKLYVFAIYCAVAGIACLLVALWKV